MAHHLQKPLNSPIDYPDYSDLPAPKNNVLGTETRLLFSNGVSNLAVHHTVASPDRWAALISKHKAEPLAPPIAVIRTVLLPSATNGKTQVVAPRILSVPLNDPAISHTSIDTMVWGLFNVFFLYIRITILPFYSVKWVFKIPQSLQNGGAGPVAPPLISIFLLKD